ncbi:tannase/feruloyl esterase family alpha/beta hydrolase [Pelagibacterium xiamenense]|uniref:tannase/feruloyl esterase family alpha/beta hydrolase n=1 Tax=Pelagibacterium xiamenense TaxID=2901140 RepID=UPI001E513673|nr:tannase/feruloyl esterase family alpha/beta hydrolase [Pelagibacterium xiamenense]MCD7060356.1 tannase/feruloyl esterase family alpha/beta hydrolase [Pelagibacterium xiamenense]
MPIRTIAAFSVLTAAAALHSGAATAQPLDCAADSFAIDGLVVETAEHVEPGEDAPISHCRIVGQIDQREGIDGMAYAIGFELRLPDDWNGDFVHQFNGGNDGAIVPALGELPDGTTALSQGYAVVSSNAGHRGDAHPEAGLAGGARFGFDPEARSDYGYSAVAKLNPVATAMVEAYYGGDIAHTYGVGRSNGGRHAMVAAARMPEAFDGLLVGYPGFNLPKAAIQHAWDVQAFKSISDDIRTAYSQDDLDIVASAVLAACDNLDGLEDGIIADTDACQATFDIGTVQCAEGQNDQCLSPAQVEALRTIHAGPTNSAGEQLYSEWAWDRGIASPNWRFWKLESTVPPWENMPIIAVMGSASLAQIFSTPPTEIEGSPAALENFLLEYDFDTDAEAIYATTEDFPESAMDFMTPPGADDPELAAYRDAGGKMIIYHGVSDPVFSVLDTTAWYEALDANNNGRAGDFVKFYRVPGMGHGHGGTATDSFDAFSALTAWVEDGTAPGPLAASTTPDNALMPELADATRKLCPYPAVPRYTGGDEASHESFTCE